MDPQEGVRPCVAPFHCHMFIGGRLRHSPVRTCEYLPDHGG